MTDLCNLCNTISLCKECGKVWRMTDPRQLLSSVQAGKALGLAASTLWRWHHQGRLRADFVTPGGHLRWDVDRLARFLAEQQTDPAPEEPRVPDPASTPEHPPVVAAVVTSYRGVLAGRRNDGKPPWTFIAGEIEPGESQADAAIREVKEETGLEVVAGHREIGRRVHPKTGRTMIYLACMPVESTEVWVGDEDELAEVRWLTLADVDELLPGVFEPVRQHLERVLA
jgi:8-oxo-dGTP pyrophosphatase MutT (NUDIX family)